MEAPTHTLVRSVFVRSLALIYLCAFISLWTQIYGLIGHNGILPAATTMQAVKQQVGLANLGLDRYRIFPTLCWFSSSDAFLGWQCAVGTGLAVLVFLGVAPGPCLLLLWLIYLSLCTISREFLSFQWDILLLETGFLAIFWAPLRYLPWSKSRKEPSRIILWLLRWLLFRLMFESGCVKLLSGDVAWRDRTALNFHYETQPLPTWIGWYAHQLPGWVHKLSTNVMFVIELFVPFLIFAPRRVRHLAGTAMVMLQAAILLTGNYCFFNLLSILLCLTLLDDSALTWLLRLRWLRRRTQTYQAAEIPDPPPPTLQRNRFALWLTIPLACMVLALSGMHFIVMFNRGKTIPRTVLSVMEWFGPLRTFNSYGLFAVMTTSRLEIIVQGSNDGVTWSDYEFKYKPGDLKRRPQFVAPHQPRLDWQMWFAALSDYRHNLWFIQFCGALLKNSSDVLGLLKTNPFPEAPPRYVRAVVYDYHFTDWRTRRTTGAWWRREYQGQYLPVMKSPSADSASSRAASAALPLK